MELLLPIWSVGPFVGLLVSIAFLPLVAPHFWHRRYPLVALAWALLFAVPFVALHRGAAVHELLDTMLLHYMPFVFLIGTLFTIAGGIVVRGTLGATPGANVGWLAAGTVLASCVGTTGASMLLVRPLLRANAGRARRAHLVVFFIFLVSNVGGALTPLGDPPLFLGFLEGVPFFWTLRLLPHMTLVAALLLGLFWWIDRRLQRRQGDRPHPTGPPEKARVAGLLNFVWLAGVLVAVVLSAQLRLGDEHFLGLAVPRDSLLRDAALLLLAWLSWRFTPRALRLENEFGWGPIREVAILFAGIFVTIVPALLILHAGERGALGPVIRAAEEPWHYFWATGALSSVLDNAPTYLTFFHAAIGRFFHELPPDTAVYRLVTEQGRVLVAISAGAVFMGANTYIGNAPNLMVRAIAEEQGVAMPSFLGYALRWVVPILLPIFLLVTLVFFR